MVREGPWIFLFKTFQDCSYLGLEKEVFISQEVEFAVVVHQWDVGRNISLN
jgi:hypothetical protein